MIIFATSPVKEKKEHLEHLGRRSFRWVIDVSWTCWELRQEVLFEKEGAWSHARVYYALSFTKHLSWGRHHTYYDGPHDSFSVGYAHFCWSSDWCQKCYDAR